MKAKSLTMPEIGLIAGTRGALGAGAALLLADRISRDQRRAVGWTLFLVGVISTFPLLAQVLGKAESAPNAGEDQQEPEPGV